MFDPEVFDKKAATGDSARVGQTIRAYTAPKVSDPIKTKDDLYAHAAVIIRNEDAINGVKGAYELDSLDESQVKIDQSVADGLTQVAKEHGVTVHVVKFKDVNATFNLAAEGVGVISIDLDGVYRETKPEDLSS